jgi:hypothetical protein
MSNPLIEKIFDSSLQRCRYEGLTKKDLNHMIDCVKGSRDSEKEDRIELLEKVRDNLEV